MRPRKRYLGGNKGTEGPTSLLFFDSESWMKQATPDGLRVDGTLRLWVAAYVRRDGPTWRAPIYHRGRTSEEFLALLEALSSWRRPLWAFAHNLGWDLTQLDFWTALDNRRWTAGPVTREPNPDTGKARPPWRGRLCLESRPTFLVLRGARGILKLVDTGNYWPEKLAAVGKFYGIPKLEKPDFNGDEGPIWPYCTQDVDVCRVAVCELLKSWLKEDCGTFQMTGPMCAMRNYMHTSGAKVAGSEKVNIVLEDDSPSRALERDAYLGARIEPFFLGKMEGPIYHLDCNSLYPFCLRSNLYPRLRVEQCDGIRPHKLRDKLYAFGAIAHVLVDTGNDDDAYPTQSDGVQVHACGQFWSSLCGPELARAIDRGHVHQVNECHVYSMADLFSTWADTWLTRKTAATRAGNVGEREFCKLILNSIVGKFGQRGDGWVDDASQAPQRGWGRFFRVDMRRKECTEWRYVAGHTQRREPGREPGHAFPAISAFCTSYAREYMRGIFRLLPPRSLLYTATDSILCTQAGFDRLKALSLVHGDEPGKFRILDTFPRVEVKGPNWYKGGRKWKVSGLHGRIELSGPYKGYAQLWDNLGSLMGSNPRGKCGYSYVPLEERKAVVKNAPAGGGWRQPLRLNQDAELSDPRPSRSSVPLAAGT